MNAMSRQGIRRGGETGGSGSGNRPLKGVVFDLDGALCRPRDFEEAGLRRVCELAAERRGYDYGPTLGAMLALRARLDAVPDDFFHRFARETGRSQAEAAWFSEAYRSHCPNIHLVNGVLPMLETLRLRHPVGVTAAGDPGLAVQKLKAAGLWGRLDALHPRSSHGAPWTRKAALEWFASRFGARGGELAFVFAQETPASEAARALGWQTVWVRRQEGPAEVPRSALWIASDILDAERVLVEIGIANACAKDEACAPARSQGAAWSGFPLPAMPCAG